MDPGRRTLVLGRPGRLVNGGGGNGSRVTGMRPNRGHFQVPARVQQWPDAQRTGRRHETVHPMTGHYGRARIHELQDALHVLVHDVLQDDRNVIARSGVSEENVLQTIPVVSSHDWFSRVTRHAYAVVRSRAIDVIRHRLV